MIVISSHVNYSTAIQELLKDILEHEINPEEVIIVIAGGQEMSIHQGDAKFTTIVIPYNFYELTAVYGVFAYLQHPLLKHCDHFLFIQDTSKLRKGFYKLQERFLQTMKDDNLDVYYASADRKCNIAGLSRNFIQACGDKYGRDGDKSMAWQAEHNGEYSFVKLAIEKGMTVRDFPSEALWAPGLYSYPNSQIKRCMVYFGALDMSKYVATCDETINPPWQERKYP